MLMYRHTVRSHFLAVYWVPYYCVQYSTPALCFFVLRVHPIYRSHLPFAPASPTALDKQTPTATVYCSSVLCLAVSVETPP